SIRGRTTVIPVVTVATAIVAGTTTGTLAAIGFTVSRCVDHGIGNGFIVSGLDIFCCGVISNRFGNHVAAVIVGFCDRFRVAGTLAAFTAVTATTTTITSRFVTAVCGGAAVAFTIGFNCRKRGVLFSLKIQIQLIAHRTVVAAFTARCARCITGVVGDVVTLLTLGAGRTFAAVAAAFTVAVAAVVAAIITFTATFSAGFSTALGVAFAAFTTVTAITVAAITITTVA